MLPSDWKNEIQESVNEAAQRSDENRKRDTDGQSSLIAGEINALNNKFDGYVEKQERAEGGKKRREIATIIVLFFTCIVLVLQWHTFDKTDDTLRIGQRPFVHLEKVAWQAVEKAGNQNMLPMGIPGVMKTTSHVVEITIFVTNNGGTGTTAFIDFTCNTAEQPLPEPFDKFKWDDKRAIQQPIGPKQTIELGPCSELSAEEVSSNAMGLIPRYVLGEIRYRDSGKGRRTQFARQLRFFNDDAAKLNGRATAVGDHNCIDENCPN